MKIKLNVNELNAILTKHFDADSLTIESITTGSFLESKDQRIGAGGMLDMELEVSVRRIIPWSG